MIGYTSTDPRIPSLYDGSSSWVATSPTGKVHRLSSVSAVTQAADYGFRIETQFEYSERALLRMSERSSIQSTTLTPAREPRDE